MWFSGQIQQALNKSKDEKIMLLTFIKGTNEDSVKMNTILDAPKLKEELLDNLVALRFDENSESAKMFNAIYPISSVPTVYLVSSDGKVFDVITGFIEKSDLVTKINTALEKQKQLKAEQLSKLAAAKPDESSNPTLKRAANESPVKTELNLKDKEQHAKELLKEIRVKKAKEEEQRALDLEKDRIRTGKEIMTAREKQQEKEMKEAIAKREREKLEDKRARDQVLLQIKQDQEDRKARFGSIDSTVSKPKPLVISTPQNINSDLTRIQFRLPDSSTMKTVFNIQDSLRTVMKYIEDNTPYRSFKLATNFPNKDFEDTDLDKTLVDLKLAPSASLVVKKPICPNPAFP